MKLWLSLVAALVAGIGIGWYFVPARVVDPTQHGPIPDLPQREFDRKIWNDWYATDNERITVRKSMKQSVLDRFKPGSRIVDVITALGHPEGTVAIEDWPPPAALRESFGNHGKLMLLYHIDNGDDNPPFFHDWSWEEYIEFVFSADGRLVTSKEDVPW
jgi:hypothetical protein